MKQVCFVAVILLISLFQIFTAPELPFDFIEYWSAYHLIVDGQNPYDPQVMQRFQYDHFTTTEMYMGNPQVYMMWNPPWLPVLFAPVLALEPLVASKVWLLVQLVLFWSSLFLLKKEKILSNQTWWLAPLAVVLFPCVWSSIRFGQIGFLFATTTNLFVLWTQRRRVIYLVPALILSSFKPHLFVLLMVALVWNEIREKKCQLFIVGFLTSAFLLLVSELYGGFTSEWLGALGTESNEIVQSPRDWYGANISGVIRAHWVPNSWGEYGHAGATIFSGICLIGTLVFLMVKRPSLSSLPFVLLLSMLSVWLAPFGWFYDQSAVFLPFLFLLSASFFSQNRSLLILILFCLATIVYGGFLATYQHDMFFFLPILILIFGFSWKKRQFPEGIL